MNADDLPSDLGALLDRLARIVAEAEAPILTSLDLGMWDYVILTAVGARDGMTQKELAQRSRRDPTRLIRHLDDLSSRGLITRHPDPSDRRQHNVKLTAEGSDLLVRTRERIREMEESMLGGFSAELRAAVAEALRHVNGTGAR